MPMGVPNDRHPPSGQARQRRLHESYNSRADAQVPPIAGSLRLRVSNLRAVCENQARHGEAGTGVETMLIDLPFEIPMAWQEGEAVFEPDLFAWVHIVKIMPDRRSAWCEIVPLEVWQN